MLLLAATPASGAPAVGHTSINLLVQRMNVNDYSIRKQVRAELGISAATSAQLGELEAARMYVVSPDGVQAKVRPYRIHRGARRFKAARADVVFKLVEDTASRPRSNVPRGYFAADGPYRLRLELPGASYHGTFSFGAPIALRVSQDGAPQPDFTLATAQPIELVTAPPSFGPVYYKRPAALSAFYQLANMEDALTQGDFRQREETPQWFFQLRVGKAGEEDTQLLDPSVYVYTAQPHLIRADLAQTPVVLPAGGLSPGSTLLAEFGRTDYVHDRVLFSASDSFSAQLEVRERVVYLFDLR